MSLHPQISVVIPHYRDVERLRLCLDALGRQSYPSENFEVVVADNNSPEGTADLEAAIDGRARLVVIPEKGAGPARNGGVAASRGEILAFTDSDCIPHAEWLAEGVRALDRADFVGGQVEVLVSDPSRMSGVEAFERVFAFDIEDYVVRKGFSVTANLICPRTVFDCVGGFRTGVSEDIEWSHRAREKGFKLGFAPRAVVGHPARHDWEELSGKWSRVNGQIFQLHKERRFGRLSWLVRSLVLPLSAIAHTPRVLLSSQLTTRSQRLAAIKVLYKLRLWRLADGLRLLHARRAS